MLWGLGSMMSLLFYVIFLIVGVSLFSVTPPFVGSASMLSSYSYSKSDMVVFSLGAVLMGVAGVYPEDLQGDYVSDMFYLDSLSFLLIYLSVYLLILMVVSSSSTYLSSAFPSTYNLVILNLGLVLLLAFALYNYLAFYIFFEISIVPTLGLLMGWGYQPERLQAGVYFLMYTMFASLPLMGALGYLYSVKGTLSMVPGLSDPLLTTFTGAGLASSVFVLILLLAFLVKMPMYMTHLWLPKAHVEAPVAGSMVLAGVLLKLGGYGIYRILPSVYFLAGAVYTFLFSLSLLGMLIISAQCCRMNDLKALVAYSSVAHMGMVVMGLMSSIVWGFNGAVFMMLGHGLSSSGFFCFVNLVYEQFSSRSIFFIRGVITLAPVLTLACFMLCAANISAPPSINLVSEIFLMISVVYYDWGVMLMFFIASFLGAVFTMYFFSNSQHGKVFTLDCGFSAKEYIGYHSLVLHLAPVNLVFLMLGYFMY